MPILSFKDLRIWQEGYALMLDIYALTKEFPSAERFGLVAQLRRAAVSVPSNIAEGFGRTLREEVRYLAIARGSVQELICQCMIAKDLNYVTKDNIDQMLVRYDHLSAGIYRCISALDAHALKMTKT